MGARRRIRRTTQHGPYEASHRGQRADGRTEMCVCVVYTTLIYIPPFQNHASDVAMLQHTKFVYNLLYPRHFDFTYCHQLYTLIAQPTPITLI